MKVFILIHNLNNFAEKERCSVNSDHPEVQCHLLNPYLRYALFHSQLAALLLSMPSASCTHQWPKQAVNFQWPNIGRFLYWIKSRVINSELRCVRAHTVWAILIVTQFDQDYPDLSTAINTLYKIQIFSQIKLMLLRYVFDETDCSYVC